MYVIEFCANLTSLAKSYFAPPKMIYLQRKVTPILTYLLSLRIAEQILILCRFPISSINYQEYV